MGHGAETEMAGAHGETSATPVRGLGSEAGGLVLSVETTEIPRNAETTLRFGVSEEGAPVTEFDVEHERRMHLIVVRRDLTGFQHLHPRMGADGTWSAPITLADPGRYRAFADFVHEGENVTLAADLTVPGKPVYEDLPLQATETETGSGYEVGVEGEAAMAGSESELTFNVVRDGRPVDVDPYLGANGHLVALREGDLAFLHVHPVEGDDRGAGIRFMTDFPSAGSYRLFLQFKARGGVHTAAFTRDAG
jgi:hypothetical protein